MVHLLGGQSSGPVRRGKSGRSDQVRVRLAEVLEGSLELVGVVIVACMGVVQTGKGRGHNTERTREQEVINHWRWCWLKLSVKAQGPLRCDLHEVVVTSNDGKSVFDNVKDLRGIYERGREVER